MGHYMLRHVLWGVLAAALLATLAAWAVHRLAGALLARWHRRFGFTELADPASLPLLMLLGGAVLLVVSPVVLAVSRHFEHEADRFGLVLTRDAHATATSFVKLLEGNLAVPWPSRAVVLLRYTHPPLGERIEFANEWGRDEETGNGK
jgi:Zn-dependent protease with chaperone function